MTKNIINSLLKRLDVQNGDVVYLTVDMSKIPLPKIDVEFTPKAIKQRQEQWFKYVEDGLWKVIGKNGTLIVHSFFYDYTSGKTFNNLEIPSQSGPFTNYILRSNKSIRSIHPVFSLTGYGKYAKSILSDCGHSGFGTGSPFSKFSKYNAIFVGLGTSIGKSMTYLHHLEQMHGVAHRFNQCFNFPVIVDEKKINGPWLVNLRRLDLEMKPNLVYAEKVLCKLNKVNIVGHSQSIRIRTVDSIINKMLSRNPAALTNPQVSVPMHDIKYQSQ